MSKQVMQRALDALERVGQVDDDCNILASNLADAVVDAIAELRAALAAQENELHDATKGAMGKGGAGGPGHIELHHHQKAYYVVHGGGGGGGAGFCRSGGDIFHASTNIAFARGGSGSAQPDTEAMRRDAERYRWLANRATQVTSHDVYGKGGLWSIGIYSDDQYKGLSEVIDAAIAAQKEENK